MVKFIESLKDIPAFVWPFLALHILLAAHCFMPADDAVSKLLWLTGGAFLALLKANSTETQTPDTMKKILSAATSVAAIAIVAIISCSSIGCVSQSEQASIKQKSVVAQANVKKWWDDPKTQAGVKIAERNALNIGAVLIGQELSGGNIDLQTAGIDEALFALRSLEMTPQAGSQSMITDTILGNMKDKNAGERLAGTIIASVNDATIQGADPSGAIEGAARGVESAIAQTASVP